MRVAALAIYPVKGAHAVALESARVEARGLSGDRRWMIVNARNRCVTQREEPRLATIRLEPVDDGLVLTLPGGRSIALAARIGLRAKVTIWKSEVDALVADDEANLLLSAFLEQDVKLVAMDDHSRRFAAPSWAGEGVPVSFADGFPVLLASMSSLAALNGIIREQGGAPVPVDRFRANIIVDDVPPWDEDGWSTIRLRDLSFAAVKPCDRCIVPSFDQKTGLADAHGQPVRALKSARSSADPRIKGMLFGVNLVAQTPGVIRVGDKIEVLERKTPWAFHPRRDA